MRDAGGFEDNNQTRRILSRLENLAVDSNLTRQTMLGVLKYLVAYSRASRQANSRADM